MATAEQAKVTRDSGVKLIVVAVGNKVDQNELESIASSVEYILSVNDFSALLNIVDNLSAAVCQAVREQEAKDESEKTRMRTSGPNRGDFP